MAEEKNSGMKLALDWLGGICAFLTVIVYVFPRDVGTNCWYCQQKII